MASFRILLVILSIYAYTAVSLTPTSPVFMWSNTNAFKGHNLQEISVISAQDISKSFEQKTSTISKYFTSGAEKPEVIIVFVEPKLSTEQIPLLAHSYQAKPNGGAFSHLKKEVETSKSSLVIPYATSYESLGTEIVHSMVSNIASGASVFVVGGKSIQGSKQITLEKLLSNLKGGSWEPLSNGVTDLIVVYFDAPVFESMIDDSSVHDKYAADDSKLGSVVDALNDIKYLAVFTSDSTTNPQMEMPQTRKRNTLSAFEAKFGQNGDQLYTTYWPDGIIEALLVMAPFLGILFLGICCTVQVQSDLKFDVEKVILKKHM